jgi:8-oxo-dGTP diphosphatase
MPTPADIPITVAIAVVQEGGWFLVGVRPPGVPLAGLAEFPGGKVYEGELPEDAAVRECHEETGLNVEVVNKYFSTIHRYDHGLLEIHFFRCCPIHAGSASRGPRPPFRWITAAELANLEFPAANHSLTEELLHTARLGARLRP